MSTKFINYNISKDYTACGRKLWRGKVVYFKMYYFAYYCICLVKQIIPLKCLVFEKMEAKH